MVGFAYIRKYLSSTYISQYAMIFKGVVAKY